MLRPTGYIDGGIAPLEEIRVPVLDRGFLYGDSVYEVFRTYAGIPFLFAEHHARLQNSARLCKMQITQSKQEIMDAIRKTIAASGAAYKAAGDDVYVRYQITRGEGPVDLFPHPDLRTRLIIIVKQVPQWPPEFYEHGVTLAIPTVRRNSVGALDPNIKGGNYLNNILGLSEARALGAEDCLLLDADGMVTECSNSNIWFVLNGKLATPAGGNLSGITRHALVGELARAGHQRSGTPPPRRRTPVRHRMLHHQRHPRSHAGRAPSPAGRRHPRLPPRRRRTHPPREATLFRHARPLHPRAFRRSMVLMSRRD